MEIVVLDKKFKVVGVIDIYESFLWVDRYNSFGDFEIYTFADLKTLTIVQEGFYLWIKESEHVMIVDERVITSDIEAGNKLIIRGRSLEWLLDRRIVWEQTRLTGNFQNGILKLLSDAIIYPSIIDRHIPKFAFSPSPDPNITSLTINTQITGKNLYEAIKDLCVEKNLGFKITLSEDDYFVFQLYMGTDRSYIQEYVPHVIFSPKFENIKNSNYFETTRILKNVALIAGEGEGLDRRTVTVGMGDNLDRRELYVDARDISSDTEEGELPDNEYDALLEQRGNQKLSEYVFVKTFEGDVETTQTFVYGKDFFLGDVVQIVNEFNIEASSRITEIIFSTNNSGHSIVPTFTVVA